MNIIPLTSLTVLPDRQRPPDSPGMAPGKIAELADSIEARGLMQPLIVERRGSETILRAGERRVKALGLLYAQGITIRHGSLHVPLGHAPIVAYDELTPIEAYLVELEENEKREGLTWQEKAAAYARLHALLSPGATPREAVIETLAAVKRTAPSAVPTGDGQLHAANQTIIVGQHLSDPDVAKAKNEREAVKILSRKFRKAEDSLRPIITNHQRILGDVYSILPTLPSASFDCIVTDPPYGIDITQLSYQNSSEQKFDDSYSEWQRLLPFCIAQWAQLLKPDADGYVFCAFERFDELRTMFLGAGFEVYPKPFIWDRSPDGRLTTAEKWPRRCYECILYFRRGARPLYEVRGDVLRYPADRDQGNYHGAKKPVELAIDLLQRSTRVGDRILDCFAGSGFVERGGRVLQREVWIVEKDPSYFGLATQLLEKEDVGTF